MTGKKMDKTMTDQKVLDGLRQLTKGNPDKMHAAADELLLSHIGNTEITNAFNDVPKPLSFGKRFQQPKNMVGRTAVLYARRSPGLDDTGIAAAKAQLAKLHEFCAAYGIQVHSEYYDDTLSGGDLDRAGLWAALDDLRAGHLLLVMSYDRLSRGDREASWMMLEIESRGAECFSLTEDRDLASSDVAYSTRDLIFLIDQLERERSRARTKRAMQKHPANGRVLTAKLPYGMREGKHKMIEQVDGGYVRQRTLEPQPAEQAVLKKIMLWHAEGKGMREICRLLSDKGITCRGGKWYHTTINNIVTRAEAGRST